MNGGIGEGGVLALITARGGSKGLPGKNIAPLAGKPLIAHTILAARGCPAVERVVVTTDDSAIRRAALEWGAEVIDRPAALATDTASSADAVRHALEELAAQGYEPDLFALLQPTSPLRTAGHLADCIDRFRASGAACAVSVTEVEHHPYKAFVETAGGLKPLFGRDYLSMPRQMLPVVLRQNGAIYLMPRRTFLAVDGFYVEPAMAYRMPAADSIDIDTAADLMQCEYRLTHGIAADPLGPRGTSLGDHSHEP